MALEKRVKKGGKLTKKKNKSCLSVPRRELGSRSWTTKTSFSVSSMVYPRRKREKRERERERERERAREAVRERGGGGKRGRARERGQEGVREGEGKKKGQRQTGGCPPPS